MLAFELESYLVLQNPVVLPTELWESLDILTNVYEIIKSYCQAAIRTETYFLLLEKFLPS